jgi:hypothetical protein
LKLPVEIQLGAGRTDRPLFNAGSRRAGTLSSPDAALDSRPK